MSLTCEFCGSTLSSKSSLNAHQKRTKSCLLKQQEIRDKDDIIDTKFKCQYCSKEYTSKQNLNSHNCPITKEQIAFQIKLNAMQASLDEKDKQIDKLNKLVSELALAPKATTINNITTKNTKNTANITNNNIHCHLGGNLNLSQENLEERGNPHYNEDVRKCRYTGNINFMIEYFLKTLDGKPLVMVADASRKKIIFRDENGEEKEQTNMRDIIKACGTYLVHKSFEITTNKKAEIDAEQEEMDKLTTEISSDMDDLQLKISKYQNRELTRKEEKELKKLQSQHQAMEEDIEFYNSKIEKCREYLKKEMGIHSDIAGLANYNKTTALLLERLPKVPKHKKELNSN
jgi:hypothetical protein